MYDNNIIKDFCTKINDNIDSMNPIGIQIVIQNYSMLCSLFES